MIKTPQEFAERLEKVEYKPGWKFRMLIPDSPTGGFIRIRCDLPTTDVETGLTTEISHESALANAHFPMTREVFLMQVSSLIVTLEAHERDEWLKYDGKHVRSPHGEESWL